jgi:hypothetical protein
LIVYRLVIEITDRSNPVQQQELDAASQSFINDGLMDEDCELVLRRRLPLRIESPVPLTDAGKAELVNNVVAGIVLNKHRSDPAVISFEEISNPEAVKNDYDTPETPDAE